jgi:hypothetical protein
MMCDGLQTLDSQSRQLKHEYSDRDIGIKICIGLFCRVYPSLMYGEASWTRVRSCFQTKAWFIDDLHLANIELACPDPGNV